MEEKMKKVLAILGIVFMFNMDITYGMEMNPKQRVIINNKVIVFNEDTGYPASENGRTYIPLKVIQENMRLQSEFRKETQEILLWGNSMPMITMKVNSSTAKIGEVEVPVDIQNGVPVTKTKVQVIKGRTYVPLRFVGEACEAEVQSINGDIVITSKVLNNIFKLEKDKRYNILEAIPYKKVAPDIEGYAEYLNKPVIDQVIDLDIVYTKEPTRGTSYSRILNLTYEKQQLTIETDTPDPVAVHFFERGELDGYHSTSTLPVKNSKGTYTNTYVFDDQWDQRFKAEPIIGFSEASYYKVEGERDATIYICNNPFRE